MERKLNLVVRPMNSVFVSEGVVTVLPWETGGKAKKVTINLFPEGDTWSVSANTNEYIVFGRNLYTYTSGSQAGLEVASGGITGGNNNDLYISGKNLEGQTILTVTAQGSKISQTIIVNTSKNFYIRFLERGMLREDLTPLTDLVSITRDYTDEKLDRDYLHEYDVKQDERGNWKKYSITDGIVSSSGSDLTTTTTGDITIIKNNWYKVEFETPSGVDDVEVNFKPPHVNVYIDNNASPKVAYFGVKSAGGGVVELKSKSKNVTATMPVYFYYPLIEPQWIEVYANDTYPQPNSNPENTKVYAKSTVGKGRGFQAANNGYEAPTVNGTPGESDFNPGMGIHSYLDMIRGAIVIADGEFIELTVNKDEPFYNDSFAYERREYKKLNLNSLQKKFPYNDFAIVPTTSAMFVEKCEQSMKGRVNVRMGQQWNGENVIQVEYNDGRKYGGAPSDLLLDTVYIGELTVKYRYSNGGAAPAVFDRIFLVYAQNYRRMDLD